MKKNDLWRTPLELVSCYRSAIMGAAALMILLYHCWIKQNLQLWILPLVEARLVALGFIGVEMFLFLSGMGLTSAIDKYDSIWTFYAKRIRRMAPAYLFAVLLYTWRRGHGIKEYLMLATGYVHVTESITALLWYVPAAMILYAVFPLYHRFLTRAKHETVFTLNCIGVWMLLTLAFQDAVRSDLWVFLNRVPVFLLGVLAGRLRRTRQVTFSGAHWFGVVIAFVLGFEMTRMAAIGKITLFPEAVYSLEAAMMGIALVLLLALLCWLMEACAGLAGRALRLCVAALSQIGRFSLELYCIHQWLNGEIYRCLDGRMSTLMINAVTILCNLLAAWLLLGAQNALLKGIDNAAGAVRKKAS
ncbi:MAG: acyltransferase [Clostridia bacterium]|nr:acyltransferase [Clostridia bacterium]